MEFWSSQKLEDEIMKETRNLSLVMDFYELTMSQCYFNLDKNREVVFDLFYRHNPEDGGLCIFAGLEQVIEYVKNLHFEKEEIEYLRSLNQFTDHRLLFGGHCIRDSSHPPQAGPSRSMGHAAGIGGDGGGCLHGLFAGKRSRPNHPDPGEFYLLHAV